MNRQYPLFLDDPPLSSSSVSQIPVAYSFPMHQTIVSQPKHPSIPSSERLARSTASFKRRFPRASLASNESGPADRDAASGSPASRGTRCRTEPGTTSEFFPPRDNLSVFVFPAVGCRSRMDLRGSGYKRPSRRVIEGIGYGNFHARHTVRRRPRATHCPLMPAK